MEYKKASVYYIFGNLFNKGIAFITVPIFTRILSTNDYGIINTFTSWSGIIAMIIGFVLHMGIRNAFVDYKKQLNSILSTVVTFTFIVAFSAGAISCIGIYLMPISVNFAIVVFCFIEGFSNAIITDYSMYLMMKYQYKFRTVLMVVPNLLSTVSAICIIKFVLKSDLYMGKIVPNVTFDLIFAVLIMILIYSKKRPMIDKKQLSYLLKISSPLIIHALALNILSQSDRMMITVLASASDTGIYSLVYNFSMIASVITTSLEGIWVPWFTQKMMEHDIDSLNILEKDYVKLITYIIIALILVSPELLKILASKPYWEGIQIIPPIVLSNYIVFLYTMYVNVEHFYKKTKYISVNTCIAAISNLIFNFIFIPMYGYRAAAYTTLASYLLSFVLHARYSKKIEKDLYPLKVFVRPLLHIGIAIAIYYCFINVFVVRWIVLIVYTVYMLILNKQKILDIFPEVKNKYSFLSKR